MTFHKKLHKKDTLRKKNARTYCVCAYFFVILCDFFLRIMQMCNSILNFTPPMSRMAA